MEHLLVGNILCDDDIKLLYLCKFFQDLTSGK